MTTYEINEKLAGLVPMAGETEQAALTRDIKKNGLQEAVVLWRGQIVDGRCRQRACIAVGERIRIKELDEKLTEADVKVFVKSVNTRRNLTLTQKTMSACRATMEPGSASVKIVADDWGISKRTLDNARFIAKERPEFVKPLFDGNTVGVVNQNGLEIQTNKITAVYAFLKREAEKVVENNDHAWGDDTFIKTQAGKEWYYEQVRIAETIGDVKYKMLVAELANYKFQSSKEKADDND